MCNKCVRGLTLIELLIFIVIIGIAANAMLGVFANLTRSSAGLLPDKQAQAIASSMMNEILAQPFTFCDPDDAVQAPAALNATSSPPGCSNVNFVENPGPETVPAPTETRGGVPNSFDNVNDYAGFVSPIVSFPDGTAIASLPGYNIKVAVVSAGVISGVPASETLRVTVTVTPPSGAPVQLDGVRIRYAPNT